ncbi:MAG: ribosome assembly RNA-binding protein YhbY [bacterium]
MLTSKQRAVLRSMANRIVPIIHVGKNGVNPMLLRQTEDALKARELIKGTVQQNAKREAAEVARELAEATGSEVVQVIGRKFVLFRSNPDESKIEL